jgi:dTMP kinase
MGGDRLEKEGSDFHRKVYDGYMELIKMYPKNIRIIDASKSISDVLAQSIEEIEKVLISKEG